MPPPPGGGGHSPSLDATCWSGALPRAFGWCFSIIAETPFGNSPIKPIPRFPALIRSTPPPPLLRSGLLPSRPCLPLLALGVLVIVLLEPNRHAPFKQNLAPGSPCALSRHRLPAAVELRGPLRATDQLRHRWQSDPKTQGRPKPTHLRKDCRTIAQPSPVPNRRSSISTRLSNL